MLEAFTPLTGTQNPQSVTIQARLRRTWIVTDLHHENCWNSIAPVTSLYVIVNDESTSNVFTVNNSDIAIST
jgi:hypothetical protein